MPKKITATPGSWKSNINSDLVVKGSPRISDLQITESGAYWLESVATEKGRTAIFRSHKGTTQKILPLEYNVRSRVHEYGGGAFCIGDESVFFVNGDDQQIYALSLDSEGKITQITHSPESRFADLFWDGHSGSLLAVRERHVTAEQCENSIVRILLDGQISTLARGEDFYAYPRSSPSGQYYCWISWSHPNMPWDKSLIHIVSSKNNELVRTIGEDETQSITQPCWGENDTLYFVSDKSDWWNIYSLRLSGADTQQDAVAIYTKDAEFATPLWVFAMQHFQPINNHEIAAAYTCKGFWHLDIINIETQNIHSLIKNTAWIDSVGAHNGTIACIETKTDTPTCVQFIDTKAGESQSPHIVTETLKDEFSTPQSIFFHAKNGDSGHAFFYPAFNSKYESREPVPLIVLAHGGPTGQTSAGLNYKIQFWTNRGFSVVDVNYRGSTGFGKRYREALRYQWGIADVEDLVSVVEKLIETENIDAEKVIIKGSSAGGFSVLAALTFTKRFNAGVSLYGIGDLELLAKDTHKFEKHYLDTLIGPYPQEKATYIERSPIHHTQHLDCSLLLFQGLEDKVVPPNQARKMRAAVAKKGLPVELIEFPDEGHGFRNPDNVKKMLEIELAFYQALYK